MKQAGALSEMIRDASPEQFLPLGDRLWVEVIPPPQRTAGGIHIPDQAQEQTNYGLVRRVGPQATEAFAADDVVMCEAYDGQKITFGERMFLLLDAEQVKVKIVENGSPH